MIQTYLIDGGTKVEFLQFDTKQDAFNFCQENGWIWEDSNGFFWNLWFDGQEEM